MSKKVRDRQSAVEAVRNVRASANDMLARTGLWREQLQLAAEDIIEEYKDSSRAMKEQRKREGVFGRIPWPELRQTSPGRFRVYWKTFSPAGDGAAGHFAAKQIRRGPDRDPYPEKTLQRFTDHLNKDLVLETERRLRRVERLIEACNKAQEVIRKATQEQEL